jgi:hypothetical protein
MHRKATGIHNKAVIGFGGLGRRKKMKIANKPFYAQTSGDL